MIGKEKAGAERRYQSLLELAPDGIVTLDLKGKLLSANAAFLKLTGFSTDELVGKHFTRLPTLLKRDIPRYLKYLFDIIRTEVPRSYEFTYRCKDGSLRSGIAYAGLIKAAGEVASCLQVICRDVTDSIRKAEEIESLAKFPSENPNPVLRISIDGTILYANEASSSILEVLCRKEGEPVLDYWRQVVINALESNQYRLIDVHCGSSIFSLAISPVVKSNYVNIYAYDITEHKKALDSLQESEEVFRSLVTCANDVITLSDLDGKILFVNEATIGLYGGQNTEDFIGRSVYSLIPEESMKRALERKDHAIKNDATINQHHAIIREDGKQIPVDINVSLIRDIDGKPYRYMAIIHDISERVRYQEELLKSKIRYQDLYDSTPAICCTASADGRISAINRFGSLYLGISKQELLGSLFWSFAHPEDQEKVKDHFARITREQLLSSELEFRLVHKPGSDFWVHARAHLTPGEHGESEKIHFICRDITDRRQAEELRRYKELFDNVADGVFILDSERKIIEANSYFAAKMGYDRPELLRMTLEDLIDAKRLPIVKEWFIKASEKGNVQFDLGMKTREGRRLTFVINTRSIDYAGRNCFLCIGRDETEARLMQNRLIRSERLAASGQLATSIAHEINSPLLGINSLLKLMKRTGARDGQLKEQIRLVGEAIERIHGTVKRLLDLNRPGREDKSLTYVNRVIVDTVSLVRSYLKKNGVSVRMNLSDKVPYTNASPQQLGQVLMNLINNSVEAIRSEACVIQTNKGSQKQLGAIAISTKFKKGAMEIRVADNGPGIPQDKLPYIFDLYYTTKKNMGMGIGLSICSSIVEDHGGRIEAKPSRGGGLRRGLAISIVLPIDKRFEPQ
jgi:PAS domain S-box-containing protein